MRPAQLKWYITKANLKKTVNDEARHKLIWGWLRLFLGFAQTSMVAAAIGSFLVVGLKSTTSIFVIAATTFTVMSLLIYRGRSDPKLKGKNNDE